MTTGKMVLKLAAQVININTTIRKKMITKRNMLNNSRHNTALHWGGNFIINGRTVILSNTCPVYNLLYMTYIILSKSRSHLEWFRTIATSIPICKFL